MNRPAKFPVPIVFLALDGVGALLVALGVLVLTGTDFGHPVLATVAPGLIALGVLLMVPMIIWVIRRAQRAGAEK